MKQLAAPRFRPLRKSSCPRLRKGIRVDARGKPALWFSKPLWTRCSVRSRRRQRPHRGRTQGRRDRELHHLTGRHLPRDDRAWADLIRGREATARGLGLQRRGGRANRPIPNGLGHSGAEGA
jgi:hypothetical protein